ncbi:MAG: DoxX family protein [Candidatus Omnitrophica bacterium]|nr:DoxX family protein [Candidatus Omnitrophota bacterium]MDD5487547.1 DoxX family protein [Candidatus Omnitrophota bacterium]
MKKETLLNFSLFVLRSVVGVIFFYHGAQKLFGMFDGVGLEGTVKLVEGLGLSQAYMVAVVWGGIELIAGMFLVFGIFSRYAATLLLIIVVVQFWKIDLGYGVFLQSNLLEYRAVLFGACVTIVSLGGGSWSVWDL